jgi:hypothetical protein
VDSEGVGSATGLIETNLGEGGRLADVTLVARALEPKNDEIQFDTSSRLLWSLHTSGAMSLESLIYLMPCKFASDCSAFTRNISDSFVYHSDSYGLSLLHRTFDHQEKLRGIARGTYKGLSLGTWYVYLRDTDCM